MYAIIKTGGKQYKVEENQPIYVEKLAAAEGQEVVFDQVLLVGSRAITVGQPTIANAKVTGTVAKQGKEKKVVTFKYKPKKHSHTKKGHRQPYTKVVISKIEF